MTNQMLLLFLKIIMIQITKMLGVMTRRVKHRSNRLKNYEDCMIVTGSLDVWPFLYIVRYTCSLNKLTFMQYF